MTNVAARLLATVRRAAFGDLPEGEPIYDPAITAIEVAEMREWLSFSHALDQPISDAASTAFGVALRAALKSIEQGVPIEEAGVPEMPDDIEYSEDLQSERERMMRAFTLAYEAVRSPS